MLLSDMNFLLMYLIILCCYSSLAQVLYSLPCQEEPGGGFRVDTRNLQALADGTIENYCGIGNIRFMGSPLYFCEIGAWPSATGTRVGNISASNIDGGLCTDDNEISIGENDEVVVDFGTEVWLTFVELVQTFDAGTTPDPNVPLSFSMLVEPSGLTFHLVTDSVGPVGRWQNGDCDVNGVQVLDIVARRIRIRPIGTLRWGGPFGNVKPSFSLRAVGMKGSRPGFVVPDYAVLFQPRPMSTLWPLLLSGGVFTLSPTPVPIPQPVPEPAPAPTPVPAPTAASEPVDSRGIQFDEMSPCDPCVVRERVFCSTVPVGWDYIKVEMIGGGGGGGAPSGGGGGGHLVAVFNVSAGDELWLAVGQGAHYSGGGGASWLAINRKVRAVAGGGGGAGNDGAQGQTLVAQSPLGGAGGRGGLVNQYELKPGTALYDAWGDGDPGTATNWAGVDVTGGAGGSIDMESAFGGNVFGQQMPAQTVGNFGRGGCLDGNEEDFAAQITDAWYAQNQFGATAPFAIHGSKNAAAGCGGSGYVGGGGGVVGPSQSGASGASGGGGGSSYVFDGVLTNGRSVPLTVSQFLGGEVLGSRPNANGANSFFSSQPPPFGGGGSGACRSSSECSSYSGGGQERPTRGADGVILVWAVNYNEETVSGSILEPRNMDLCQDMLYMVEPNAGSFPQWPPLVRSEWLRSSDTGSRPFTYFTPFMEPLLNGSASVPPPDSPTVPPAVPPPGAPTVVPTVALPTMEPTPFITVANESELWRLVVWPAMAPAGPPWPVEWDCPGHLGPCAGDNFCRCSGSEGRVTQIQLSSPVAALNNAVLNGILSDRISEFSSLWLLSVSGSLTGTLPSTLADLNSLRELRLDGNRFSGTIPAGLGTLDNFDFQGNQLVGTIPAELSTVRGQSVTGPYDGTNNCFQCLGLDSVILATRLYPAYCPNDCPIVVLPAPFPTAPQTGPVRAPGPDVVGGTPQPPSFPTAPRDGNGLVPSPGGVDGTPVQVPPQQNPATSSSDLAGLTPVLAGAGGGVAAIALMMVGFCTVRRRRAKLQAVAATQETPLGDVAKASSRRKKKSSSASRPTSPRGGGGELLTAADVDLSGATVLGEGSQGQVVKALVKNTGEAVAVKQLTDADPAARDELLREGEQLKQLHHKNIVQFRGFEVDGDTVLLFLNFYPLGSLLRCVYGDDQSAWIAFTDDQRIALARGCGNGLKYLHKNHVVHRDIAARNVLLELTPSGAYKALLSDFGLARAGAIDAQRTQQRVGALPWMAPEQFESEDPSAGMVYSTASDMWAFGCLLYELFAKQAPYHGVPRLMVPSMIIEGRTPSMPAFVSRVVAEIMTTECWRKAPADRASAATVLAALDQLALQRSRSSKRKRKPKQTQYVDKLAVQTGAVLAKQSDQYVDRLKKKSSVTRPAMRSEDERWVFTFGADQAAAAVEDRLRDQPYGAFLFRFSSKADHIALAVRSSDGSVDTLLVRVLDGADLEPQAEERARFEFEDEQFGSLTALVEARRQVLRSPVVPASGAEDAEGLGAHSVAAQLQQLYARVRGLDKAVEQFRANENLYQFCVTLQMHVENLFVAAKAASTALVDVSAGAVQAMGSGGGQQRCGQFLRLLGSAFSLVPVPGAYELGKVARAAGAKAQEGARQRTAQTVQRIADLLPLDQAQRLAKGLAVVLTERHQAAVRALLPAADSEPTRALLDRHQGLAERCARALAGSTGGKQSASLDWRQEPAPRQAAELCVVVLLGAFEQLASSESTEYEAVKGDEKRLKDRLAAAVEQFAKDASGGDDGNSKKSETRTAIGEWLRRGRDAGPSAAGLGSMLVLVRPGAGNDDDVHVMRLRRVLAWDGVDQSVFESKV